MKNRGNDNPKDLHCAAVSTRDEPYPEAGCNSARWLGGRGGEETTDRVKGGQGGRNCGCTNPIETETMETREVAIDIGSS